MKKGILKIGILAPLLIGSFINTKTYAFEDEYSLGDGLGIIVTLNELVNPIIQIIITLIFLIFFWNLVLLVKQGPGEEKERVKSVIWSLVAIFFITSLWGIIAFVKNALQIDEGEVRVQKIIPTY